jgi:hypothetical protein
MPRSRKLAKAKAEQLQSNGEIAPAQKEKEKHDDGGDVWGEAHNVKGENDEKEFVYLTAMGYHERQSFMPDIDPLGAEAYMPMRFHEEDREDLPEAAHFMIGRWMWINGDTACVTCGDYRHVTARCLKAICTECQHVGHTMRLCPRLRCRHCHDQGHFTKQCPDRLAGRPKLAFGPFMSFTENYLAALREAEKRAGQPHIKPT